MDIEKILRLHKQYLIDPNNGEKANLCGADLRGADLLSANLCSANLRGADLRDANLCGADLHGADLRGADLCDADLRDANLCDANLCGADLRGADLRGADLCGANLCGADLIIIQLPIWVVYIYKDTIRIGCQYHTYKKWFNFTDDEINEMDAEALTWWNQYKPLIKTAVETIN